MHDRHGAESDPFAHFVREGAGGHVGRHLILDLWGVEDHAGDDLILGSFEDACRDIGAKVMFSYIHPFGPDCGTTGVVILAESHLTWHHYPEVRYIAIDIFVCGTLDPDRAIPRLISFWKPREAHTRDLRRGRIENRDQYLADLTKSR